MGGGLAARRRQNSQTRTPALQGQWQLSACRGKRVWQSVAIARLNAARTA